MSELKDKAAKGLIWGGVLSVSQQFVGVIFSILIARQLTPTDYGMVGMLSIFVAVATVLQESGFVFSLTNINTISRKEYSSVFWFNVTVSMFIYILLFISAPLIADFFKESALMWLSRYIFLVFLISSFSIIQTAYFYKEIKVKERTIATLSGLIVSGLVGVIMAYNGFCYWGIATQNILNVLVSTIVLWCLSPFRPCWSIDVRFLKKVIPDGIKFAIPNLFATIGVNIFSVILGRYYQPKDVGDYSQASKWNVYGYSIPLGMLRNISQPTLVQVKNDKVECLNVFRKLVRMTCFVTVPIMFTLSLVAPELVEILMTSKWLCSAYILRILCLGGVFTTLMTLNSYFIMSQNWTNLYMYLGIANSILQIAGALFASFWGVTYLAVSYFVISIICFFVYYWFINKSHNYRLSFLFHDIMPIFLTCLIIVLSVGFVTHSIEALFLKLLMRIVLISTCYLVVMHFIKYDSYMEIKILISQKLGKWKNTY